MKGIAALCLAACAACTPDHVRQAAEEVQVVGGSPTVSSGLPSVSYGDGGPAPSFGLSAPFQVDTFVQNQVQKVDILWVVDNSPSMLAKQDRLQQNVKNFMQFLQQQNVDYHLGVVSTDTYDPRQSGLLQNDAGLPQPWINADAGAGAEGYFFTDVGLGEEGSGDEKGLLGGMMALTAPLAPPVSLANPDAGAGNCARLANGGVDCFVRPDAALYTVIVSDEEDSSCSPIGANGEGCSDSDIVAQGGYGTTDYWSRFYAGVKGQNGVSKMAAITATDTTLHDCATEFAGFCDSLTMACAGNSADCNSDYTSPCCSAIYGQCTAQLFYKAQWCHVRPYPGCLTDRQTGTQTCDPGYSPGTPTTGYQIYGSWNGCLSRDPGDGGVQFTAFTGARYAAVAQATGGIAGSICDADYTPTLSKLGLQASGLRTDFPLSRTPIAGTIAVTLKPAAQGQWRFVGCENHAPVNALRFSAPPAPGTQISVSYDVNVHGLGTCP